MPLIKEFRAFVAKGNVVDLAVAVVVGGAFSDIVKAFVTGLAMPLVSYVLPARMAWEEWTLGKLRIGLVLGAGLHFLIISAVVFIFLVKIMGRVLKRDEPVPEPAPTRICPECLETIPQAATRCKFCTSTSVGA